MRKASSARKRRTRRTRRRQKGNRIYEHVPSGIFSSWKFFGSLRRRERRASFLFLLPAGREDEWPGNSDAKVDIEHTFPRRIKAEPLVVGRWKILYVILRTRSFYVWNKCMSKESTNTIKMAVRIHKIDWRIRTVGTVFFELDTQSWRLIFYLCIV